MIAITAFVEVFRNELVALIGGVGAPQNNKRYADPQLNPVEELDRAGRRAVSDDLV